jgi:hypothetical protein
MGRADLTNEQWVRLVPPLPIGKKLHASFAKLSLGPCRGGMSLLLARWLAQNRHCCHCRSGSGSRRCWQEHSLTCGFAVNVNIRGGVRIFKTGVSSDPAQAGSIPVRLR